MLKPDRINLLILSLLFFSSLNCLGEDALSHEENSNITALFSKVLNAHRTPREQMCSGKSEGLEALITRSKEFLNLISYPPILSPSSFSACEVESWLKQSSGKVIFMKEKGEARSDFRPHFKPIKSETLVEYFFDPLSGEKYDSPHKNSGLENFMVKLGESLLLVRSLASADEIIDTEFFNYYSIFERVCELLSNCDDLEESPRGESGPTWYLHKILEKKMNGSYSLRSEFSEILKNYHFIHGIRDLSSSEGKILNEKLEFMQLEKVGGEKDLICLDQDLGPGKKTLELFAFGYREAKRNPGLLNSLAELIHCSGGLKAFQTATKWNTWAADGLSYQEISRIQKEMKILEQQNPRLKEFKSPTTDTLRRLFL